MKGKKDLRPLRTGFQEDWLAEQYRLILDILLRRTVTRSGLFFTDFDAHWRRGRRREGTLVSQSRLISNMGRGFELSGDPRFRRAAEDGVRFLLTHFRDRVHGGFYFRVGPGGRVLDADKDGYGHAFVVFGLARAAAALEDESLALEALEVREWIMEHLADGLGGVHLRIKEDLTVIENRKSQNPLMHLFEAHLALAELEDKPFLAGRRRFSSGFEKGRRDAEALGRFVLGRLIRRKDGMLPEYYNSEWREKPAEEGGQVDVGHLFEWAFLLSRAGELGFSSSFLQHGKKILDTGLRIGFDQAEGGVFSPASPDGTTVKKVKGWWEQCEAARALLHYGIVRKDEEAFLYLKKTLAFIEGHLVDPVNGGWYTWVGEGMDPHRQPKMNFGKVYYHAVELGAEARRLTGM